MSNLYHRPVFADWREGDREVDYVSRRAGDTFAIEVASGGHNGALPGIAALLTAHPRLRPLLVGAEGIPVERFLLDE